MNYEGCITKVDRRKFVAWIGKKKLTDFRVNLRAQREYIRTFLGINKEKASARILEILLRSEVVAQNQ